MAMYRHGLPQLNGGLFLTDGGIETTLIFHNGIDLPYFAAFHLLRDDKGKDALRKYYEPYVALARQNRTGFILESATWRASRDWGDKLGYPTEALAAANREAIALLQELRAEYQTGGVPMVVSGCVGPRGDGYDPGELMTPDDAQAYHSQQIQVFADTEADMITAITMTNSNEAIGVARAAKAAGMPAVISFTVETDGRLPTGQTLRDAIETVDRETQHAPAYYMVNCAHPSHFAHLFANADKWVQRIRGIRANASKRSHAELDQATDLDAGDPVELGRDYADIRRRFPHINVLGGCCGTDHRHIELIYTASSAVNDVPTTTAHAL